jgi:hypothetical protein
MVPRRDSDFALANSHWQGGRRLASLQDSEALRQRVVFGMSALKIAAVFRNEMRQGNHAA